MMILLMIMDLELLLTGQNHLLLKRRDKREDTAMKLLMDMQQMMWKLKISRMLMMILLMIMDLELLLTGPNL